MPVFLAAVPFRLRKWWKKSGLRCARWAILVLAVLLVALAGYLWKLHEPVPGSVSASDLTPGLPIKLLGITGSPPAEAVFRDLLIEKPEGESKSTVAGAGGSFLVKLPVNFGDCRHLARQIGGGCSGAVGRARDFESLDVRSLRFDSPLRAMVEMKGLRALSLSHGARPLEQDAPTGWTLEENGHITTLSFDCMGPRPTPLMVLVFAARSARVPVHCVRHADTYRLRISNSGQAPVPIFVNDVDLFAIEGLWAQKAILTAGSGTISVGGDESSLSPGPKKVVVLAADGRHLTFGFEDFRSAGREQATVQTDAAASFEKSNEEQVPNWLERHKEFAFIILTVLLALTPLLWKWLRGN